MIQKKYSPPNYCHKVHVLTPFESREEAESWSEKKLQGIWGVPILIPFKNPKSKRVEFLKPRDPNDCLRIMGAANHLKSKNPGEKFIEWVVKPFKRDFAPHLMDLEGDTITPEENVCIIMYNKRPGGGSVGQKFAECFREEKEKLKKKIAEAPTNTTQLNPAEIFQDMSTLPLKFELDIGAGMNYFYDENTGMVYRHTFCRDASDKNLRKICLSMKNAGLSTEVIVHNNKIKNYHFLSYFKDLIKGLGFAAALAVACGILVFPLAGKIAAIIFMVAVMVPVGLFIYFKASRDNPTTFDFPDSGLKTSYPSAIQNTTFLNALKVYLANLLRFFSKSEQLPTQASPPVENVMVTQGSEAISQHPVSMPNSSVEVSYSSAEPKKGLKGLNWLAYFFKLSSKQQGNCGDPCIQNTETNVSSIPAAAA